jgi:pimeloyl-ACP methyl ester carboxylesterase
MTEKKTESGKAAGWGLGSLAALALVGKAGWILYSKKYIDHHAKVNLMLDAEHHTFESDTVGKINYYESKVESKQTPILLVHGIHMYAGGHDMVPVFEAFCAYRKVYVIDLPGFGGSEKTDRPYRPILYSAAISEFIRDRIGQPVHVVVMGQSAEFVAITDEQDGDLYKSIVMIDPSGMQMPGTGHISERKWWEQFQNLGLTYLKVPLWSLPFYDILASRSCVLDYYRKRFTYTPPSDLVDLAYTSAHQPGAHFAPIMHYCGKLSVPDVRTKHYEKITKPVLVVFDNDPGYKFDMLPMLVREHANWQAIRSSHTRGMPHFESPGETFRSFETFWKKYD